MNMTISSFKKLKKCCMNKENELEDHRLYNGR